MGKVLEDDLDAELDSILADEDAEKKAKPSKAAKVAKKPKEDDFDDSADEKAEAEMKESEKEATSEELDPTEMFMLDITKITVPDDMILRDVPEEDLDELIASIENDGQLQPVLVTTDMVLIDGHRRLLAHKKMKAKHIGARIIDVDESHRDVVALVANTQRKQLSTSEKANAYKKLLEDKKRFPTQKALAKALGVSEADISLTLKSVGEVSKYDGVAEKRKTTKEKAKPAQKSHRMSEENLPEGITVVVSKHELNIGIKLKIKSEAQAKTFDLKKELAAAIKEVDTKEFCNELRILRELF